MVVNAIDETFLALSDSTRRNILEQLMRRGSATVTELAEPFGITQQAISKHLALLERARLIEKRREGRQHFCSLRPAALEEACAWMDRHRALWNQSFDRLDVLLEELERRKRRGKRNVRSKQ
jgi:DNA-binding transcriptional ArsR family regulator